MHLSQLSGCEVGYHSPGRSQDRDVSGGRWTCALPLVNLTIQAASIKGWRRGHHWGGERVLKVWVESNFLPGCSSVKQDIRKRGLPTALSFWGIGDRAALPAAVWQAPAQPALAGGTGQAGQEAQASAGRCCPL